MNRGDKLIIVAGPTASGKTSFAIKLAQEIDAVLINMDSRQVYKFMDIGTNKGKIVKTGKKIEAMEINGNSKSIFEFRIEGSEVNGFLFDIVRPDESFTVSDFIAVSGYLIEYFKSKDQKYIFVGGTGLYIDRLISEFDLPDVKPDEKLREKLQKLSTEQLYDELYSLNTEEAISLNPSDRANKRRLIRRIEIAKAGLKARSRQNKIQYKLYYPKFDRKELYEKIDCRVEKMFEEGLVQEVEDLIRRGYKETIPMKGMGYKEVVNYLDGKITLEECKKEIKKAHRNYAKRQITWFEGPNRDYRLSKVRF